MVVGWMKFKVEEGEERKERKGKEGKGMSRGKS
jgi:hypothetical protein